MNRTVASCPIALALLGIMCASAGNAGQALPGGANSLQEAHGDWRVACEQPNGQKRCTLSQQLMDKDSRQRILAIELTAPASNKAEGTLVLPFGLALDHGITLQVDEAAASPTLRFRTCLPMGCVVPLTFDPKTIVALRTGTALTVKAVGDNGQEIAFSVSLKGFASAFDRTLTLAK